MDMCDYIHVLYALTYNPTCYPHPMFDYRTKEDVCRSWRFTFQLQHKTQQETQRVTDDEQH